MRFSPARRSCNGTAARAMTDPPPPQPELALAYPLSAGAEVPLLPARMVNEFVYCPRLAYLEWVQGEWAESADTVEGRFVHRRTEDARGAMPDADALDETTHIHARSITLASETSKNSHWKKGRRVIRRRRDYSER